MRNNGKDVSVWEEDNCESDTETNISCTSSQEGKGLCMLT